MIPTKITIVHFIVPCTHRKDCSVGNWGDWKGRVNAQEPGCYEQTRSRPFMYPLQTTYMRVSCGRLRDTCGSPPTEKRKQCMLIVFVNYCLQRNPDFSNPWFFEPPDNSTTPFSRVSRRLKFYPQYLKVPVFPLKPILVALEDSKNRNSTVYHIYQHQKDLFLFLFFSFNEVQETIELVKKAFFVKVIDPIPGNVVSGSF